MVGPSVVRSCVRAFVRSCGRAFVRAFVRSCVRAFVCHSLGFGQLLR